MFEVGDRVIYRVTKHSSHPGPRARDVRGAPQGETYSYAVDKFWVIAGGSDDGRLLLRTRRGKEHLVRPDDPNLRQARWWERLFYSHRFPNRDASETEN